jgi:hypothetical protein
MADITTIAIYDVLAGDSLLAGLLAPFGAGSAIFTAKTVPPDASRPYIWTYGDVSDVEDEGSSAKDLVCRSVTRDIWIVADDDGSEDPIMEIANRVRDLLHRTVLAIGTSNMKTAAAGPRVGPSEGEITARIVTVSFVYQP